MSTDVEPGPASRAGGRQRAGSVWRWSAILTVAGAGLLHLAAAADHVDHSNLVVGFFLAVAAGQVAAAGWLFLVSQPGLRPRAALVAAMLAATVALIALYLVVHRTGLLSGLVGEGASTGHHAHTGGGPGHPVEIQGLVALDQPVIRSDGPGLLGTATLAVETVAVVALAALLPRTWRARTVDVLCALGALTWVLWLTGVLG